MSTILDSMKEKAKASYKHIVLAEGEEERIIVAAEQVVKQKIAKITLIGSKQKMAKLCPRVNLDGINIVDPAIINLEKYADYLFELRKAKGMEKSEALKLCADPLYLGVLMVKMGEADGMVAGSVHSTGDVLRPAMQIIKTAPGISIVSSCFIMVLPNQAYGDNGVMIFGDCAVNPNPTAQQLADIAYASAMSAKNIAGITNPKIAMLSFSTFGSAKHELVDKVVEATKIAKSSYPELDIDGEMQLDAAIIGKVAALKAPNSKVAGNANVLIFPDLQAGNIGYKLVQRLANAEAVGPICQGFNKPVNDLSRGCSSEDVVNVVAMTSLQCK